MDLFIILPIVIGIMFFVLAYVFISKSCSQPRSSEDLKSEIIKCKESKFVSAKISELISYQDSLCDKIDDAWVDSVLNDKFSESVLNDKFSESVLNDKFSELASYQDALCDKINNRDTHTSVTSYTPQQIYTTKQVDHQPTYGDLLETKYWYDISYDDLLSTKEWQDKRNKILNRDGHKCVYCGKTHDLQVHHKYYSKYPNGRKVEPWNYPDDALITLCDNCHKRVHSKKKIKVYYRRYYDNY